MTGVNLLSALGNVSDRLVEESFENPKASKQQNGESIDFSLKKLAVACAVIAVVATGVAVISLKLPNNKTPNNIIVKATESPATEDVEKETKVPEQTKTPLPTVVPTSAVSPTPVVVPTVVPTPVPTAAPVSVPGTPVVPTKEPTYGNELYAKATAAPVPTKAPDVSVGNHTTIQDRVDGVMTTNPPTYIAGGVQGNSKPSGSLGFDSGVSEESNDKADSSGKEDNGSDETVTDVVGPANTVKPSESPKPRNVGGTNYSCGEIASSPDNN